MKCPNCGLINPDDAVRCGCGYDFGTETSQPQQNKFYRSFDAMGVKEFFVNSWRTFGANWTTFLILSAIPVVVSMGLVLGLASGTKELAGSIITVIIVINLIVWILTTMALTMAAHKTSDGEAIGFGESYILCFGLFCRYIWTGLLYFLIVLGGFLLLIIPGIIWSIRYFFAPYAVIIEGIGGREALSNSKAVTQGRLGGIFVRELGYGLLFMLAVTVPLALLTLVIATLLGQPFPPKFAVPPIDITLSQSPNPEWAEAIQTFGRMIWEVLFIIFNVLLYKSINSRRRVV